MISASGSGQMQPLPMNEYIQENLAEVGINVEFEVMEWNTLINIWRAGVTEPSAQGRHGHQHHATPSMDPFIGFMRHMQCKL